jgi:hypothetical protein
MILGRKRNGKSTIKIRPSKQVGSESLLLQDENKLIY